MEKKFEFSVSTAGSKKSKIVVKKESELTEQDRDLLLGHYINEYEKLPEQVQDGFLIWLFLRGTEKDIN